MNCHQRQYTATKSFIGCTVLLALLVASTDCVAQTVKPKRTPSKQSDSKPEGSDTLPADNKPPITDQERPRRPVERPFRENMTLPFDSNLVKRFGTAEDLLANGRLIEAFTILQELAQTESQSLVLVHSGKVGGVATYLNATTRCSVLLSRLPEKGRAIYRQKYDPQAKRWLENWQRTSDQSELLKIVRLAYVSSYTDEALLALGEAAWDEGDYALAREWWEQLVPFPPDTDLEQYPTVLRYPDPQFDEPQILARIILCSILERNLHRATEELRQFTEKFPQAEGQIAGRSGSFVQILEALLSESQKWALTKTESIYSTFGGSPEREFRSPETLDVGAEIWQHTLPGAANSNRLGRIPFNMDPLCFFPVTYENTLDRIALVNDASAIRAWNLLSGQPAWASAGKDPAVIYPPLLEEQFITSERATTGVPQYTMTIDHGHLFARMGSPVTCYSTSELRLDSDSEIVCLDLAQQGKLVWKSTARELFPDDLGTQFEGTPVVMAGKAYVVTCRRHPQLELSVVCLDASDGRMIWNRPIGAFRNSVDENKNRISHLLLTAGANRLYLSTDVGAVIALDAADGRLDWAISYERRFDDTTTKSELNYRGTTPALYHRGLLFIAPADAFGAYCIEADSGRIRWFLRYFDDLPSGLSESARRETEQRRVRQREWKYLLGVVPGGIEGRLIASGTSLWWVDVATGRIVYSRNVGSSKGGFYEAFGRGLIAGNEVFFSTRDTIEIFNARSGDPIRSVQLRTPDRDRQGGNLVLSNGILLIAQQSRISAFGDFSRLKERSEQDLTDSPHDATTIMRIAEIEESEGNFQQAVERIQDLLEQTADNRSLNRALLQRLVAILITAGERDFETSNSEGALANWTKALDRCQSPNDTVRLIMKIAVADEELDHSVSAVSRWQSLLSEDRFRHLFVDGSSVRSIARREITRLIHERGRDCYREIETRAATQLDSISKQVVPREIERFISSYPHADVKTRAQEILADWYQMNGKPLEACAIFDELRQQEMDDARSITITLKEISLLESANASGLARRLWQSLENRSTTIRVEYEGKNWDLSELARANLSKQSDLSSSSVPLIERSWTLPIADSARVISPERAAPGDDFSGVLVCSPHKSSNNWTWQFIHGKSGTVRWSETAPCPVERAFWNGLRLIIATKQGWQARACDDGQAIWNCETEIPSQPLCVVQPETNGDEVIWPVLFNPTKGARFIDPLNGEVVAEVRPEGRFDQLIAIGDLSHPRADETLDAGKSVPVRPRRFDSLIAIGFQSTESPKIWKAVAKTPRDRWSLKLLSNDVVMLTAEIMSNHLIGTTDDHHLVGYELMQEGDQSSEPDHLKKSNYLFRPTTWTYNNLYNSFTNPTVLSSSDQLYVIDNGLNLVCFDPLTGARKWVTGIAQFPFQSSSKQISIWHGHLYAAANGILKGVSLYDGKVRFETDLGRGDQQWKSVAFSIGSGRQTTGPRTLIATWPQIAKPPRRSTVLVCDAESGTIIQQIGVDGQPRDWMMSQNGHGIMVTSKSLCGLKLMSVSPAAAR